MTPVLAALFRPGAAWLAVAIIMCAMLAYGSWQKSQIAHWKAEADKAEAGKAKAEADKKAMTDRLQALLQATKEMEKALDLATARARAKRGQFSEVRRNDKQAGDWSAVRVPDSVRGVLGKKRKKRK